jgi:hypothetical protein
MVRTKGWKGVALGFSLLLLVTQPALAYYDEYGDSESHPLRLAAYALHPAGCAIEWLVIRPLHAIVSQPQLAHLFGHRPHETNFSCGYTPVVAAPPPIVSSTVPEVAPPPIISQTVPQEEAAEARKAAEEAKQAAEEAKRAAQAAEAAAQRTERVFERTLRK